MALSLFGSATAGNSDATVTAPANIIAGDLLVLWDGIVIAGASEVVPTGFTKIAACSLLLDQSVDYRTVLSYKIAAGTEGGTEITGMASASTQGKTLGVFRDSGGPIIAVAVGDASGELIHGDPADQIITASGGTPPLIVLGGYASTGAFTPGFSPAATGQIGAAGGYNVTLSYKLYDASPADVTISKGDNSDGNALAGCYLSLTIGTVTYSITASVGTFVLTGIAATLNSIRSIAASAGTFVLTGIAVALVYGRVLSAAAGSFLFGAYRVILPARFREVLRAIRKYPLPREADASLEVVRRNPPKLTKI